MMILSRELKCTIYSSNKDQKKKEKFWWRSGESVMFKILSTYEHMLTVSRIVINIRIKKMIFEGKHTIYCHRVEIWSNRSLFAGDGLHLNAEDAGNWGIIIENIIESLKTKYGLLVWSSKSDSQASIRNTNTRLKKAPRSLEKGHIS